MIIKSHLRAICLQTGTALCVVIMAAYVMSAFRPIILAIPDVGWIAVSRGSIAQANDNSIYAIAFMDRSEFPSLTQWNSWIWVVDLRVVPLYSVFLVVAIATLLVWRFAPKCPPGHCKKCGYDLTGNTSGRCPECGTSR